MTLAHPVDLPAAEADLADAVGAWLRENLPPDWLAAVDAGDHAAVERIRADPGRRAAWFDVLGASGLATPTWPWGQGGLGLTADRASIVTEQLVRYRAERPNQDFVGLTLAGPTILEWGTDEQKAARLPALARGRELWCQLFSEPGAGSDLAALSTRAVQREDSSWLVNGQKVWNSYAHLADFGLLMARTDPAAPKHRGITYFLLDMRTPGVEPRPLKQMTGNAEFNETFLTDVVVPDSARLGPVNQGWAVAITTLMQERNGLSGRPVVGQGESDRLVGRALTTGAWRDPLLRDRLVSAFVEERALQMTTIRGFVAAGSGAPTAEGSIRKLAHATLSEKLGVLGTELEPDGAVAWDAGERPVAVDAFLAMKTYSIAGGTSEIQRNIISERVLGMPKDPDPERHKPFQERSRG
ncbi:MAG: Acyl-CoA dehydrogenase [Actinomycetia bacterium]|nr:Acyl-CoA dehydrogenase [Actinomycetes bacterium]